MATNEEVIGKNANLSIPLYVRTVNGNGSGDGASLQQAITGWEESSEALRASMAELFEVLEGVQTTEGRK